MGEMITEPVHLVLVPDLTRPTWRRRHLVLGAEECNCSLAELARRHRTEHFDPATGVAAIINGAGPIRGELLEKMKAKPGDQVTIAGDPGAGITLVSVLSYVGELLLSAALLYGLQWAAKELGLLPEPPEKARQGEDEASPTYTWSGIQTTYGAGFRIPLVYGIHRVGGQVIGRDLYEVLHRDTQNPILSTYTDHLRLLIALCEGPVFAIGQSTDASGNKSPHLRPDQPLPANTAPEGLQINGSSVLASQDRVEVRFGDMHQPPFSDWVQQWQTYAVGQALKYNEPVVYTTNGNNVADIKLRVLFSGLYYVSDKGKYFERKCEFQVRIREAGTSAWSAPQTYTIWGLYRTAFTYTIRLTWPIYYPPGGFDIEVKRLSGPDSSNTMSESTWSAVIEGSQYDPGDALAYPRVALMSLDLVASSRLSSASPRVTVPVYGRPVGWYDSGAWQPKQFYDSVTGKWPGRNPAWVLRDFLTNKDGGLGHYLSDADLVLEDFIAWADYCDEMIDNGMGGTEPRCQVDAVVDDGAKAWDHALRIARAGNAVLYPAGNLIGVRWMDPDRSLAQVFNSGAMSNLQISWLDQRLRPNIIDVQILNENEDWEQDMVSVEDADATGVFEPWTLGAEPLRRQVVKAWGVTRPSQALRMGNLLHAINTYQTMVAEFDCQIDALAAEVGDIIGIECDLVQFFENETWSFRAYEAGSGANSVKLDKPVTLATGHEIVILSTSGVGEVRNVTSAAGTYSAGDTITFSGDPVDFAVSAPVSIGKAAGKTIKTFEIISIDLGEDLTRHVRAYSYDTQLEAKIAPKAWQTPIQRITKPSLLPVSQAAENVKAEVGEDGGTVISWTPPAGLEQQLARVFLREVGEDTWRQTWEGHGQTSCQIPQLPPWHEYEICVMVAGVGQPPGAPNEDDAVTVQMEEFCRVSPASVARLTAEDLGEKVRLAWAATGEDLDFYEVRLGTYWCGGQVVGRTRNTELLVDGPYGTSTFWVRPFRRGVPAGEATSATVDKAMPPGWTLIKTETIIEP